MNRAKDENDVASLYRVTKRFGPRRNETPALSDISLRVFRGEMIVLLGPSGSGKTTLLTLLAGLQCPTEGTVRLFGKDVTEYTNKELQNLRAHRIGFIFQSFHLLDALSVLDNVLLVRKFAKFSRKESRDHVMKLLERLGIEHLAGTSTRNLS